MTDTRPPRLPNPAHRWWSYPTVALAGLILVAVVVTALLPARLVASKPVGDPAEGEQRDVATPYAMVPAAVEPVAERVSLGDVRGVEADTDPDGRVYFVTISEPAQSVLGWWVSRSEPEIAFSTHEEKYGTQTPSQRRTVSLQMMRTSGQVAQYVALSRAGFDAEIVPGPVQVEQFVCLEVRAQECAEWAPSESKLEIGDMILSVDGTPVGNVDELTAALEGRSAGDTVDIAVERIDVGEIEVPDVELIGAGDGTGRAIIGFLPFDTDSVSLPFEINIDTGEIGGPSAGLAFTLTLLDELTAGDLLGGRNVAVTGTINLDGDVGAIGGLRQKASAVRQAGLDYFVVPAGQSAADLDAARAIAGDGVEIIPVANVDEALDALERLGGDPPAPLPSR